MAIDQDDILRRAMAAHFRSGGTDQPSSNSGVQKIGGKWYAVLRNVRGVMSVYRVRNDGKLKKLVRLPAGLE